jgi:DnaK suppressor protein
VAATGKTAAKSGPKPAPRAPAKPAAKPTAKPAAKGTTQPAAKATAKTPAKTPAKAPAKATTKAPARPPVKAAAPAPSKAPAKSPAKAAAQPTVKATPAPAPAPKAATRPATARPGSLPPSPAAVPPTPEPAPAPHRFTDRFAPARAPVREVTETPTAPKPVRKVDPKLANAWKTKAGRELTEEELLAMPDGEYMNEKQLEFFRARLQQQKDDLLSNAGETTEHLREDTSIVPDPADRATIEEEHALELRTRDRERKLLKKIAQSLARLESGDYGYCDETGEPIGLARLLARPTATLSLEAQQRRELKQKMFGD